MSFSGIPYGNIGIRVTGISGTNTLVGLIDENTKILNDAIAGVDGSIPVATPTVLGIMVLPTIDSVLSTGDTTTQNLSVGALNASSGTFTGLVEAENRLLVGTGGTLPTDDGTTALIVGGGATFSSQVNLVPPINQSAGGTLLVGTFTDGNNASVSCSGSSITLQIQTRNYVSIVDFTGKGLNVSSNRTIVDGHLLVGTTTDNGTDIAQFNGSISATTIKGTDFTGITETIGVTVDGGGTTVTTGLLGYRPIDHNYTITGWQIICDQSGSIQFDIGNCTFANYPTTSSIVASAPPLVSSAISGQSGTLTGWTTTLAAGGFVQFSITSATTVTKATLVLQVKRI
jgi:hypothetical protein